jgi:hypothetical protein
VLFQLHRFEELKMAQKKKSPASELSAKDLAEPHLEDAIAQLSVLMKSDDPQVALEATNAIIGMARPAMARGAGFAAMPGGYTPADPGGFGGGGFGGWPGGGGFGGWPGGFGGWPGGFGGWPGGFGGFRTG